MVTDLLLNAGKYYELHKGFREAFHYLQNTDLSSITPGRYMINGDDLFAIVQEYETLGPENEKMESHRKYIDVQYMIKGAELVGLAMLKGQTAWKEYDDEGDYMLYAEAPDLYAMLEAGTFMIFYPTDLHMPCLKIEKTALVKKVVVKVKV